MAESYREQTLRLIAEYCKDKKECGSCRWWQWRDSWDGECRRLFERNFPFHKDAHVWGVKVLGDGKYEVGNIEAHLSTGMHFGCVLWEEKP